MIENPSTLRIPFLFVVIALCSNAYGAQSEANQNERLEQNVFLNRINLPDDRYCTSRELINALCSSGLQFNWEQLPFIKGKDIVLKINPKISETEPVWTKVAKPRSDAWVPMSSASGIVSVTALLDHYAREVGDYQRKTTGGMQVLLPKEGDAITERVTVPRLSLTNTCVMDIFDEIHDTLSANDIGGFIIASNSIHFYDAIKFDLDFPGGTLAEFLTEIVCSLDEADGENLHYWVLRATYVNLNLHFWRFPKEKYERLFEEQVEEPEVDSEKGRTFQINGADIEWPGQ